MMGSGVIMAREVGVGERAERTRRLWFWGTLGGLAVVSAVTGFVAGYSTPEGGWLPVLQANPWIVYAILAAVLSSFVGGSWFFFAQVDELELADNLWASMIGLYAYAMLLPVWWALWQLGKTSEPDHWAIYAATLGTAGAVYVWRKLRLR